MLGSHGRDATVDARSDAARIAAAYEQLASVLERLDLDSERVVADNVVEAMEATEAAYRAAVTADERSPTPLSVDVEPAVSPDRPD